MATLAAKVAWAPAGRSVTLIGLGILELEAVT